MTGLRGGLRRLAGGTRRHAVLNNDRSDPNHLDEDGDGIACEWLA